MAHPRQDFDRVGLDLHPATAAVAGLSALKIGIDDLPPDGNAAGQAVDDHVEGGAMGFAGGEQAKHQWKVPGEKRAADLEGIKPRLRAPSRLSRNGDSLERECRSHHLGRRVEA